MLLLILIDVQYLQNAIFSFEIGLNCQNHSSSDSFHPEKKIPPSNISDSLPLGPSINWALQFLKNETKTFLFTLDEGFYC